MKMDKHARYNEKRVPLANFSVTKENAKDVEPAFGRMVKRYGGKVAALTVAIIELDERHNPK